MSITLELTQQNFQDLCKNFDSTKNMSYEATKAIFEYYENLSDDMGKSMDFDISMIWVFTEYTEKELVQEFRHLVTSDVLQYDIKEVICTLQENTTVIELENGNYLVMEF